MKIRVELLEEWHAQCVDPMGCRLPVFWIKSGGAWYRLGRPLEEYRSFLLQESLWLLATYRCALYLTQCPRATFDDALAVIGGRNWLRSATGGPGSYPGAQCRYSAYACVRVYAYMYTRIRIYIHSHYMIYIYTPMPEGSMDVFWDRTSACSVHRNMHT
jgi:hypothetical protein